MTELARQLQEAGNAAFKVSNFALAVTHYTDAIDIDPKSHILYSNRSAAYAGQEDFTKARADAIKCTQLAPDFPKGWSRLGLAHFHLSDFTASKAAYEKALTLDPTNAEAIRNLPILNTKLAVPATSGAASGQSVKRKLEELRSEKGTRADLVAELYAPGPMAVKNELVKRLNCFPAKKQDDVIDPVILANDLEILTKSTPFAFLCVRCDKAKISTVLATWKKDSFVCHACHDHLTHCVIPVRELPAHMRPAKCRHQVPLGYLKQFRN
jgi:tetratricopeptide (TPR) repeat protein